MKSLPVNVDLFIFTQPSSYNGEIAASKVPNSESMPSKISIMKNSTDQNGDTSIRSRASEKVMNARPGPEPSYESKFKKNKIKYQQT